jgi:hypothetical protein
MREFSDPNGLRPHFPIEVRFSDSDDIWLSPSNGQRTCWIGIVQFKYVSCFIPSALAETCQDPTGSRSLTRCCSSVLKLFCAVTAAGLTGQRHITSVRRHFADCILDSTTSPAYLGPSTLVGCFAMSMWNATYLARQAQDTTTESSSVMPLHNDIASVQFRHTYNKARHLV